MNKDLSVSLFEYLGIMVYLNENEEESLLRASQKFNQLNLDNITVAGIHVKIIP